MDDSILMRRFSQPVPMDDDPERLKRRTLFKDKIEEVERYHQKRRYDLQMLMFLHRQQMPRMSLEDAFKSSSQMIYDEDMKNMLMDIHIRNSQGNMNQRKSLGLPYQKQEDYIYRPKSLRDLWEPKGEIWT